MSDLAEPVRRVRFAPPMIGEEEINEVIDTLRSDWLTTGPKTRFFEEQFAQAVNAPSALALNSCTAGLHLALLAHGIGPGDEVITTPITFAATANVIEHVGARLVLVDVEPDTLNIDPQLIERAITRRTRAIIPVHFAGHPVDIEPVLDLAQHHQFAVIEDAAHALPASFGGRMVGSRDNLASFSFYATKNMTTCEGGMLVGDPALLEPVRALSLHGLSRDAWKRYDGRSAWKYDVLAPGFKYNMTDLQAAMGIRQLERLDQMQRRRQEIFQAYDAAFSQLDGLQLPVRRPHVQHALHLYVIRLDEARFPVNRDQFIDELQQRGVPSSVHFIPIHLHTYYREKYGYRPDDFPVARDSYRRMLSLPLSPGLTDDEVQQVIQSVCEVARPSRRMAA